MLRRGARALVLDVVRVSGVGRDAGFIAPMRHDGSKLEDVSVFRI